MTKQFYINTMGCQMNVYDSEQIALRLNAAGYTQTEDQLAADVIILNTCSIRDKAEQKVYSFLGRLRPLKNDNPRLIIAVGGCVAQQEAQKVLKRIPYVDLVFGTRAVPRLTEHLERIERTRRQIVDTVMEDDELIPEPLLAESNCGEVSRFVTIMRGCDNFCSYCVVPYVRGREKSRTPESILSEVNDLVAGGVAEVTLLGQNVNSYGAKEGLCSFSELLQKINGVAGLKRLRFTTSHPKDFNDDVINAFATLPKLCHHIHLPVQSGSTAVLASMNRKYTREDYLTKVGKLREVCPDMALTTDIIVGFPGETEEDFLETLALLEEVRYDGLFAFKYSDRKAAPASQYLDKVPLAVKSERLQRLLELQERLTRGKNESLVGTVQEVLAEGRNLQAEKDLPQWSGRTGTNKIVHFVADDDLNIAPGMLVKVKIERALSHSLLGKLTA